MEKDQRINESTLNCPSKMLRRRLWAVLIVDTVGGDLGWSLDVKHVSRSFFALPVTQVRIKGILILFISYVWISLNHIQDSFGVLDENFRIYTLVTPIKYQHFALYF
jgi:hypothetical protein